MNQSHHNASTLRTALLEGRLMLLLYAASTIIHDEAKLPVHTLIHH
jgi:hypothetical protein